MANEYRKYREYLFFKVADQMANEYREYRMEYLFLKVADQRTNDYREYRIFKVSSDPPVLAEYRKVPIGYSDTDSNDKLATAILN